MERTSEQIVGNKFIFDWISSTIGRR